MDNIEEYVENHGQDAHATSGEGVRMGGLSKEQLERYARHIVLPEFGEEGQRRLLNARVLCVGVGGLGSPVALYLAGAGVGVIGIADSDLLELPNLQRQIVHSTGDVGKQKVETAKQRLHELNPDVTVRTFHERVTEENVRKLVSDYDVVVDGCDNPETRYVLNDACYSAKKTFVHGSIFRYEGRATTFTYDPGTPCYRCIYPSSPSPGFLPSGAEAGIASPVPGLIGMIQVAEVMKLLLGKGELLVGRMVLYDMLAMTFRELRLAKDPGCSLCGNKASEELSG